MAAPTILGLDPGFASYGWAAVRLDEGSPVVIQAGVIRTEMSANMRSMLAAEDNIARSRLIWRGLRQVVADHAPGALAAESMSWPRNAGAAAKVALGWGVTCALADVHGLAVLTASPQYVKKALCGARDASKAAVEAAVKRRASGSSAADAAALAGLPKGAQEHMYDAMAVALAVADYEVVRLLRR